MVDQHKAYLYAHGTVLIWSTVASTFYGLILIVIGFVLQAVRLSTVSSKSAVHEHEHAESV
jgi:hypothetical protein